MLLYRAGVLSEEQAWQKLYAGFRRGEADDRYADLSLKQISKDMRETHAYMRIYWSGALYFLEAELRLREETDLDLNQVLQRFNDCCRDNQNRSGLALAEAFDRVAATSVFVPLYKRYEKSLAIPDFVAALAAAGLTVDEEQVYISGESTLWNSH